jgi:hypothetical protein
MPHLLRHRILENNGAGWYWEVVSGTDDVVARGLADTHVRACEEAQLAIRRR